MFARSMRSTVIIVAAMLLSGAAYAKPKPPIVAIAQGKLAGYSVDGVRIFKAIPYALPPIGERRWKSPAAPSSWQGTRNSDGFGPACPQPAIASDNIYYDPPPATSEDCLTLNIWAPANAKKMPVIVWIHGGSLLRGTGSSPMYDGAAFAKRGVLFVSINYRLGVLGWLAHPALSAESPESISGNYGLLDQIAALQWVRANASAFGGDPANITVMGESAGALSITYLLASPNARGLFQKAIIQSPNIRAVPALKKAVFGLPSAEAIGSELAAKAGADNIAKLRAMDAEKLAQLGIVARFVPQGTVDGKVLPAQVVEVFDRGEQVPASLLAGFNSGEIRTQRSLVPHHTKDPIEYEKQITERYGSLAAQFLRLYPFSDIEESMLRATRDVVYGWAAERMVRQQTTLGIPSYLYLFDHCDDESKERKICAFHASELPYVFGQTGPEAALSPNWPRPNASTDTDLSRVMIGYWTAFARTGRPYATGAPKWAAYGNRQSYMRFSDLPRPQTDPETGMFELQEEVFRRRRAAGEQWFTNIGPAATAVR